MCSGMDPVFAGCMMVSRSESVGKLCNCAKRREDDTDQQWAKCLGPCWHKLDVACAPKPKGTKKKKGAKKSNPIAGLDHSQMCPDDTEYTFAQNSHLCIISPESAEPRADCEDGKECVYAVPSPTALMIAVLTGDQKEVARLLAHEKEKKDGDEVVIPNTATEGNGFENALMAASELGLAEIVEILLANKKVLNVINAANPGLLFEPRGAALFMPVPLTYAYVLSEFFKYIYDIYTYIYIYSLCVRVYVCSVPLPYTVCTFLFPPPLVLPREFLPVDVRFFYIKFPFHAQTLTHNWEPAPPPRRHTRAPSLKRCGMVRSVGGRTNKPHKS